MFALYTSLVLIDFKLNHPEVHNMGDAGKILGGPLLREILAAGTVIFAVCATGSQLLAGQITLSVLSDNKLCLMWYTGALFSISSVFPPPSPGSFAILERAPHLAAFTYISQESSQSLHC